MNFKPGDKVWIDNPGGLFPQGTYAGVVSGHARFQIGHWRVDVEGVDSSNICCRPEIMRRRYDPPDWVKLCKLDEVRPSVAEELV